MRALRKANGFFRSGKYESAVKKYEEALHEVPELKEQILFNISMANKASAKRHGVVSEVGENRFKEEPARNQKPLPIELYERNHPAAPYLLSQQLYAVDVIVPVYNALEEVKRCLKSLSRHNDGYKLKAIVVNDSSDQETTDWLRRFCHDRSLFYLIEHQENRGYTKAVNTGLKNSQGDYVVTLNSDAIVTKGWLQSLIRCVRSDEKLGVVGPLSNAASWQNVPHLLDENKQFAVNNVPLGMTPDEMAALVRDASHRLYPRVPFVNGFCFMVDKRVIEKIGLLDEEAFPTGYGEENDYCIRAADAGFELAIADDAYVFHAKSKSFGHEKRKELTQQGSANLKSKHTDEKVKELVSRIKKTKALDDVRERINFNINKSHYWPKGETGYPQPSIDIPNFRVLFLLPVQGGGGGAHSVVQEAYAMRRLGMDVHVAMKHEQVSKFINNYDDVPGAENMFVGFSSDGLIDLAESYDVVVATLFSTVTHLKNICEANPHILPAYYIQDYEPLFFEEGSGHHYEALRSYNMISDAFCFAKTNWIIDKVWDHHGVKVERVTPSIDHEVYKVHNRNGSREKVTICAMIRPKTPRRGAARTMNLLSAIYNNNPENVEIKLFGCESADPEFQTLETDFEFSNYGVLKRPQVAQVLSASDVFIDLSDYQAFGRTGLEAMACGAVSVLPLFGGAHEYAVESYNAVLVDTFDEEDCFLKVSSLISSRARLRYMQRQALLTAASYSVHKAAVSELVPMSIALNKHRQEYPKVEKSNVLILPSLQKDQKTATGSAYVRLILPYRVPEVLKSNRVKVVKALPDPNQHEPCTLILQRDVPSVPLSEIMRWIGDWKKKGHRVVYDLDDDLLELSGFKKKGTLENDVPEKVRFFLQHADLVTVSTPALKKKVQQYSKEIILVENRVDKNLWGLSEPMDHSCGDYKRNPGRPVTIGYVGTPSHVDDLSVVKREMKKVEKKYGDGVKIEVIGVFQNIEPTFGERAGLPKKIDYPNFVNWLRKRVHWDIGIIPLENSEFNKSKSHLKFLEYAALDMAIVVSDNLAYSAVAAENENCLISRDDGESWFENVSRLVEDQYLREKIAKSAFNECKDFFVLDENYTLTAEVLDRVKDESMRQQS